jgi:hypothetical protein
LRSAIIDWLPLLRCQDHAGDAGFQKLDLETGRFRTFPPHRVEEHPAIAIVLPPFRGDDRPWTAVGSRPAKPDIEPESEDKEFARSSLDHRAAPGFLPVMIGDEDVAAIGRPGGSLFGRFLDEAKEPIRPLRREVRRSTAPRSS